MLLYFAGLKVAYRACCGAPPPLYALGQCGLNYTSSDGTIVPWTMCDDRNDYMYWDALHLSEAGHKWIAKRVWTGPRSVMYPMNLSSLVMSI